MANDPHVKPVQEVVDFATACFVEDIPPTVVLAAVGVNRSTWGRWRRKGTRPERPTMAKCYTALADLVAQRDQRAAGPV